MTTIFHFMRIMKTSIIRIKISCHNDFIDTLKPKITRIMTILTAAIAFVLYFTIGTSVYASLSDSLPSSETTPSTSSSGGSLSCVIYDANERIITIIYVEYQDL